MKVAIIGGGLAGLSAAVELSNQKTFEIDIYEKSSELGGRIREINSVKLGKIDLGQHLLSGAYEQTFEFIKKINPHFSIHDLIEQKLFFVDENQRIFKFQNEKIPFPLNLIHGIFSIKYFSMSEKIKLIKILIKLKLAKFNTEQSFNKFYLQQNVKSKKIDSFWQKFISSIFNSDFENLTVKNVSEVIKKVFFKNGEASRFYLPKTTFSDLLIKPAEKLLLNRKVKINKKCKIDKIKLTNSEKNIVVSGIEKKYDLIISAVQTDEISRVLNYKQDIFRKTIFNPIITFNIENSEKLLKDGMYGLTNSIIDWVFVKGKRWSVVISNAKNLLEKTSFEIQKEVFGELNNFFNSFSLENVVSFDLVKIKKATIMSDNLIIDLPTKISSQYIGLYITGDWTFTKFPQTIESAIASGKTVSERILNKKLNQ